MIPAVFAHEPEMLDRIELQGQSVTHKRERQIVAFGQVGRSEPAWYWRQPLLEALPGGDYAIVVGKPSVFEPAFSFKASVNSCKLETIWGALVRTVEASFSA